MLKNPNAINDPDVLGDVSPIALQPIIMAFKGMDKVEKAWFSTVKISESVSDNIKELNRLIDGTEMNEILKIYFMLFFIILSIAWRI